MSEREPRIRPPTDDDKDGNNNNSSNSNKRALEEHDTASVSHGMIHNCAIIGITDGAT